MDSDKFKGASVTISSYVYGGHQFTTYNAISSPISNEWMNKSTTISGIICKQWPKHGTYRVVMIASFVYGGHSATQVSPESQRRFWLDRLHDIRYSLTTRTTTSTTMFLLVCYFITIIHRTLTYSRRISYYRHLTSQQLLNLPWVIHLFSPFARTRAEIQTVCYAALRLQGWSLARQEPIVAQATMGFATNIIPDDSSIGI